MNTIAEIELLEETFKTTITSEYLDEYGHMNVKWYAQLWGWGASGFMNLRGMNFKKDAEIGIGYWVLRQVIDYKAEVLEGDTIAIYGRMVSRSDKCMHNMYWMVNETQGKIAATSEVLVGYADLEKRRLTSFPTETAVRLDEHITVADAHGWEPVLSGAIDLRK
jgi:acyl-CoA thioester hydrolase